MSDGILDGIFLIIHRTFPLSYFRGCRLLDFSVLKVWGHMMKPAIQLVAAVFRDFKIQRRDDNENVA